MTEEEDLHLGIIGLGDMGKLYAHSFLSAGFKNIHACDRPEKYETLKNEFKNNKSIIIHPDGFAVVRKCDFVMYVNSYFTS